MNGRLAFTPALPVGMRRAGFSANLKKSGIITKDDPAPVVLAMTADPQLLSQPSSQQSPPYDCR